MNEGVFDTGVISRTMIQTGWGARNNVGSMLVLALPFPFYFASKKLFPAPWIIVGVGIFAFTVMTSSRVSILCAAIALLISYVVLVVTARNRFGVLVTTAILTVVLVVLSVRYFDKILEFIKELPDVFAKVDGDTVFTSAERATLYKSGIDSVGIEPIFGITFYPTTYDIYDVATLESFSSFFPPRWHNTIIQVLVSCGFVGLFAYLVHRISTVAVFIKRKNQANVFIGISILSLILMSLLDSHFFNVGPTLFYSMMLAVMEFGEEEI
jgi:O-antigen ligase